MRKAGPQRIALILGTLVLAVAASPVHAQTEDLAGVRAAVDACVKTVRGIWPVFDAYVSPDGRVHNNAVFAEQVYSFEKCLAEHGLSLHPPTTTEASQQPPAAPPDCSNEEFWHHPGDCWVKLSPNAKRLLLAGIEIGWVQSEVFNRRLQYQWSGTHVGSTMMPRFDNIELSYINNIYQDPANRDVSLNDAFSLAFRRETNPNTEDEKLLLPMYRRHEVPIFSGFLQSFLPPNKVIVSDSPNNGTPRGVRNYTNTITLLGTSSNDKDSRNIIKFMDALINIERCNTFIPLTDVYKLRTDLKTDQARENEKKQELQNFNPKIPVIINYPQAIDYRTFWRQEEFFNDRNELSGLILLDKSEIVCGAQKGPIVTIGRLMLKGAKDESNFNGGLFGQMRRLVNLNQYVIANGFLKSEIDKNDHRTGRWAYFDTPSTPDGVKEVMTVGAPMKGSREKDIEEILGPPTENQTPQGK